MALSVTGDKSFASVDGGGGGGGAGFCLSVSLVWATLFCSLEVFVAFEELSELLVPALVSTVFLMLSEPFTSPLMATGFFFTEFDLFTIGNLGSFSITFLGPRPLGGPTEDFLDLTADLSDSVEAVEDSLSLRLGEGDLSRDFLARVLNRALPPLTAHFLLVLLVQIG